MTGSWLGLLAAADAYAIPLAALIVSGAALIYSAMGGHRQSRDREMSDLRKELDECKSQRAALERENIALMRDSIFKDNESR